MTRTYAMIPVRKIKVVVIRLASFTLLWLASSHALAEQLAQSLTETILTARLSPPPGLSRTLPAAAAFTSIIPNSPDEWAKSSLFGSEVNASTRDAVESKLTAWLNQASEEELTAVVPALLNYLTRGGDGRNAPTAGKVGSSRWRMASKILAIALSSKIPAQRSLLLVFYDVDDPKLRSQALASDLDRLLANELLLPDAVANWIVDRNVAAGSKSRAASAYACDACFTNSDGGQFGLLSIGDRQYFSIFHSAPRKKKKRVCNPPDGYEPRKGVRILCYDQIEYDYDELKRFNEEKDFRSSWLSKWQKTHLSVGSSVLSMLGLQQASISNDRIQLQPYGGLRLLEKNLADLLAPNVATQIGVSTSDQTEIQKIKNSLLFATRKEIEFRAELLYSLAVAKATKLALPKYVDITNVDAKFDELLGANLSLIHSTTTDHIDREGAKKINDTYDVESKTCAVKDTSLLARRFSLVEHIVSEDFAVDCIDGRTLKFTYLSSIPTGLQFALRRQPRLLDPTGLSIAGLLSDTRAVSYEDFELIASQPEAAIPRLFRYYLEDFADKNYVSWKEIRETIMSGFAPNIAWLYQPKRYTALPGVSSDIAWEDTTYSSALDSIETPMRASTYAISLQRYIDIITPAVNALPNTVPFQYPVPCPRGPDGSGGGGICGYQRGNKTNPTKFSAQNNLKSFVEQISKSRTAAGSYDLSAGRCSGPVAPGTSRVKLLFTRSADRFIANYTWRDKQTGQDCGFGYASELNATDGKASPELRAAFASLLTDDPSAFTRRNLDISPTGLGGQNELTELLAQAVQLEPRARETMMLMRQTFLLGPIGDPENFLLDGVFWRDNGKGELSFSSRTLQPVNVTSLNMLVFARSAFGIDLGRELSFLDRLSAPPSHSTYDGHELTDGAISDLSAAKSEIRQQAIAKAEPQAQAVVNDLKASQKKDWFFGFVFTINGFGPSGMMYVKFGDTGVNLTLKAGPSITIVPTWKGFSSDGFKLANPGITPADSGGALPPLSAPILGNSTPLGPTLLPVAANIADGSPTNVVISTPWTAVPSVKWSPGPDTSFSGDKAFMAGLIVRGAPAMSDAEFQKVLSGLTLPSYPQNLADFVWKKAQEGIELQKIQDREWYQTDIVKQLLPTGGHGMPCPVSGCININNDAEVSKYITDFNAQEHNRFEQELAKARSAGSSSGTPLLRSDLPAVTLTYGNDYRFLLISRVWPTQTGTLTDRVLIETPFWLLPHVRANPYGHEFEKLTNLIMDQVLELPKNMSSEAFAHARADMEKRLDVKDNVLDPMLQGIEQKVLEQWRKYWDEWNNHSTNETQKNGFSSPFVTAPEATPFLKYFDPPWQQAYDSHATFEDWMQYQNGSNAGKQMQSGQVNLPKPTLP